MDVLSARHHGAQIQNTLAPAARIASRRERAICGERTIGAESACDVDETASVVGKSSRLAAQQDLTGTILGRRYRLVRLLGRGGMGAVYEAVQENIGRTVAIKVILSDLADELEVVRRFRLEAQAAASLRHPNIIQVTDFEHTPPEPPFLVMELLHGASLRDAARRDGPLAAQQVQSIAIQILSALDAAHRAGIVHRDLKPDNIFLVDVSGVGSIAKLLDFGIAKLTDGRAHARLTSTGVLVGTPAYMASEQLSGAPVDGRTDIYALGVTMFRVLTARLPYQGMTLGEQLRAMMSGPRPRAIDAMPGLDPMMSSIVERAMAIDPRARFQSAAEMAQALMAWRPGSTSGTAMSPVSAPHATASQTVVDRGAVTSGAIAPLATQWNAPNASLVTTNAGARSPVSAPPGDPRLYQPGVPTAQLGSVPSAPVYGVQNTTAPSPPPALSANPGSPAPQRASPSPRALIAGTVAATLLVVGIIAAALQFRSTREATSSSATVAMGGNDAPAGPGASSAHVPPVFLSPLVHRLTESAHLVMYAMPPQPVGSGPPNPELIRDALAQSLLSCLESHHLVPTRAWTESITMFLIPGNAMPQTSVYDVERDAVRLECLRNAAATVELPPATRPGLAGATFMFQTVAR